MPAADRTLRGWAPELQGELVVLKEFFDRELLPVVRQIRETVNSRVGSIQTVVQDYTVAAGDEILLVDAASGPVTVLLLPADGYWRHLKVKKVDATANAVTLVPPSGVTVDGAANHVLAAAMDSVTLYSDQDNYWVE